MSNETLDHSQMEEGSITNTTADNMKGSVGWMRFLSILGFLGSALTLIGGIMVLAAPTLPGMGQIKLIGLIYIVFAGIYIYISYLLWQWADKSNQFGMLKNSQGLEEVSLKQKQFWKTVGIFTIVMIVLVIILMVVSMQMAQSQMYQFERF